MWLYSSTQTVVMHVIWRDLRLEVLMAVKLQVKVFWVVTLHSVTVGDQHFGGPCCLYLYPWRSSKTWVFYSNTTWHHNPEDLNLEKFVMPLLTYIILKKTFRLMKEMNDITSVGTRVSKCVWLKQMEVSWHRYWCYTDSDGGVMY